MGNFRLLHTSDWHLGGVFHEQPREYEERAFLDWLLGILPQEEIDALIVAGDVFDRSNPSPPSRSVFFDFVAAAKSRLPGLEIVVLPGDHDSALQLDSSFPASAAPGVHVLGPMDANTPPDRLCDRFLITLHGSASAPVACLAALPYLGPSQLALQAVDGQGDHGRVDYIRSVYEPICQEAVRRAGDELAAIAAGHLYLAAAQVPGASEYRLRNRYLPALPADLLSSQLSYVALGHLHVGQSIGDSIFYSGSPLAMSFTDSQYCQQVLIAEFEGARLASTRAIPVPRPVELLQVPSQEPQPLEQVIENIRALEEMAGRDPSSAARPYLEVRVRVKAPFPGLRQQIMTELGGKWPRLVKISLDYDQQPDHPAASPAPPAWLDDLNPEAVFRQCYREKHASPYTILNEPSERLMHAFGVLCEEQQKGDSR